MSVPFTSTAFYQERKLTLVGRLYAWSIALEPLLFFVFAHQSVTGISANLGRVLQILVLTGLVFRWSVTRKPLVIFNPSSSVYVMYTYYYAFAILAGVLGLLSGAYSLEARYDAETIGSSFAAFIRGPAFRPIFEYIIAFYYFAYFVVLPRYLLNSENAIRYFFRVFCATFVLCLVVGIVDLALDGFGYQWLPRHMSDGVHVGFRFHGLAGEPRDAFVYLMFGLAVLVLREFWLSEKPLNNILVAVIFVVALFTQSASGILGLLFAGLIIFFVYLTHLSARIVIVGTMLFVALAAIISAGIYFSPRVQLALTALWEVFGILDRGEAVPPVLVGQMPSIYPIWDMYKKLISGEILPIIIGSGLGSSSVTNSVLWESYDLANPHTQIVRVFYETGLVGMFFLTMTFIYPARLLTKHLSMSVRRRLLLFTILLVGAFLSHRSATAFIYLGIFILVMQRSHVRVDRRVVSVRA